jgi:hypothetical protein
MHSCDKLHDSMNDTTSGTQTQMGIFAVVVTVQEYLVL